MNLFETLKQYFDYNNQAWLNIGELADIEDAVKTRADKLNWYVIHYNIKTGNYELDFEFKTLEKAIEEFKNAKHKNSNDRIELIFAPEDDEEEFGDNILVLTKTDF